MGYPASPEDPGRPLGSLTRFAEANARRIALERAGYRGLVDLEGHPTQGVGTDGARMTFRVTPAGGCDRACGVTDEGTPWWAEGAGGRAAFGAVARSGALVEGGWAGTADDRARVWAPKRGGGR